MSTVPKQAIDSSLTDQVEDNDSFSALVNESIALQRKVDILQSIPDLIIVFNSSGKIMFASNSVVEFFRLATADDIEGTSFWKLVTDDSKVAIQRELEDSITADLGGEEDCIPLASGTTIMIKILVADEQGRLKTQLVSLKGTLHMNEGNLECICSIRPIVYGDGGGDKANNMDVVVSDNEESHAYQGMAAAEEQNQNDSVLPMRTKQGEDTFSVSCKRAKIDSMSESE